MSESSIGTLIQLFLKHSEEVRNMLGVISDGDDNAEQNLISKNIISTKGSTFNRDKITDEPVKEDEPVLDEDKTYRMGSILAKAFRDLNKTRSVESPSKEETKKISAYPGSLKSIYKPDSITTKVPKVESIIPSKSLDTPVLTKGISGRVVDKEPLKVTKKEPLDTSRTYKIGTIFAKAAYDFNRGKQIDRYKEQTKISPTKPFGKSEPTDKKTQRGSTDKGKGPFGGISTVFDDVMSVVDTVSDIKDALSGRRKGRSARRSRGRPGGRPGGSRVSRDRGVFRKIASVGRGAIGKVATVGKTVVSKASTLGRGAIGKVATVGKTVVSKASTLGRGALNRVASSGKGALSKVTTIGKNVLDKVPLIGKGAVSKGAAKSVAKTATKSIAKAGLKGLIKKIPFVGAGAGVLFAAQRALKGDLIGAGLEIASGAASIIPGIGTAASLGVDAVLAARDIKGVSSTSKPKAGLSKAPGVASKAIAKTKGVLSKAPSIVSKAIAKTKGVLSKAPSIVSKAPGSISKAPSIVSKAGGKAVRVLGKAAAPIALAVDSVTAATKLSTEQGRENLRAQAEQLNYSKDFFGTLSKSILSPIETGTAISLSVKDLISSTRGAKKSEAALSKSLEGRGVKSTQDLYERRKAEKLARWDLNKDGRLSEDERMRERLTLQNERARGVIVDQKAGVTPPAEKVGSWDKSTPQTLTKKNLELDNSITPKAIPSPTLMPEAPTQSKSIGSVASRVAPSIVPNITPAISPQQEVVSKVDLSSIKPPTTTVDVNLNEQNSLIKQQTNVMMAILDVSRKQLEAKGGKQSPQSINIAPQSQQSTETTTNYTNNRDVYLSSPYPLLRANAHVINNIYTD